MVYATDPTQVLATATLNNEQILFKNVHLSLFQDMFGYGWFLKFPFIIGENNTLDVELTNTSASSNEVSIKLLGWDSLTLDAFERWLVDRGQSMFTPSFLYISQTTILAGATRQQLTAEMRPYPVRITRMFMGSDNLSMLRVGIGLINREVQQDTFPELLNAEFRHRAINIPLRLGIRDPLYLYVTNTDTLNTYNVSFLAEVYSDG